MLFSRFMADEQLSLNRRKQRWIIIAFFFFSGIFTATWSSRIPDVQQKLGLSNAELGTTLFAVPAGLVSGLFIAGWLIATIGYRRVLLFTCLCSALLLATILFANTQAVLMLVLFFFGVTRTIYNLAANTGALEVQQLFQRPIISRFHGVWSLACFAAAGVTTLLIVNQVSIYHQYIAVAAAIALSVLLIGVGGEKRVPAERRPFFVKPDKYLLLLGLTALCAMLCEGAMFDWSVNYFEQEVKPGKGWVTAGYLSFIIAMTVGRFIGDKLIAAAGMFRLININAVLMAGGFALAAMFPAVAPAAIGFALIGFGDSVMVPIIYMLAAKSKSMSPAYALSSVTLIGYTGFVIGPLFIGNVSEHVSMRAAFFCLTGISLLIVVLQTGVRKLARAQDAAAFSEQ